MICGTWGKSKFNQTARGNEGGGSGASVGLWKGLKRTRRGSVSVRKWNKRWFWNEGSYKIHSRESVMRIIFYFFSKLFYLIHFSNMVVEL